MRNIYITVAAFCLLSILLFVGAFVYLDKEKHNTYYYVVNVDGRPVGAIKAERFVTEDKLLYKSSSTIPFYPALQNSRSKMTLSRKYDIETLFREKSGGGANEILYAENNKNNVSFVSVAQSEFAYLADIPVKERALFFDEDSPFTYLPLIENYDFRRGRAQGFNTISIPDIFLPPIKRVVTLTSIRDEYIEIGSRKIKAEQLLVKMRNYPPGSIWVAKSDRSLMMMEMPQKRLRIIRAFSQNIPEAKRYVFTDGAYISKDVTFKNKGVGLAGTITVPKKEGTFPAALLICGDGPHDRDCQGFFASLADSLSKDGFCVLRFDKRGIGSSEGDFSATTDSDDVEDSRTALEYLAAQKEADPDRLVVIGHAEGALHAVKLASSNNSVKALILIAPKGFAGADPDSHYAMLKRMASKSNWNEDYLRLASRCYQETINRVKGTKHNWAFILRKRCFLKKMRERLEDQPNELVKKITIPVLILQNKDDEYFSLDSAATIDKTLEEAGNKNHSLTYFGYLNHFFGDTVNDGIHTIRYEAEKAVSETIKRWVKGQLMVP